MMADVSGFSRLMGSNEDGTVDLIRDFHHRVQLQVDALEGRVVDTAGDSVFGEFDSVVNAIQCARRIQEEQTRLNAARPVGQQIEMRIGVHLGDVIVEDYHVYGDGVNIAARLEGLAVPGGIAISEAVYQQVRDKLDLPVRDLGLQDLKNIQHPVHVYELNPAAVAGAPAPKPTDVPPLTPVAVHTKTILRADPPANEPIPPGSEVPDSWRDAMMRSEVIIPASISGFLILSPVLLFPTGGVLPTGGAILLATTIGRLWARIERQRGAMQYAIGAAVASGALWTNWSGVTNSLFVLGGLIVAASGQRRPRKGL